MSNFNRLLLGYATFFGASALFFLSFYLAGEEIIHPGFFWFAFLMWIASMFLGQSISRCGSCQYPITKGPLGWYYPFAFWGRCRKCKRSLHLKSQHIEELFE